MHLFHSTCGAATWTPAQWWFVRDTAIRPSGEEPNRCELQTFWTKLSECQRQDDQCHSYHEERRADQDGCDHDECDGQGNIESLLVVGPRVRRALWTAASRTNQDESGELDRSDDGRKLRTCKCRRFSAYRFLVKCSVVFLQSSKSPCSLLKFYNFRWSFIWYIRWLMVWPKIKRHLFI